MSVARQQLVPCVAVISLSVTLSAQTGPRFEVASVKPNGGGGAMSFAVPDRGAITITNYPALALILFAYDIKNRFQIVGYPRWLETERFDVRALPPDGAQREHVPFMMQALLEERFKMRARWVTDQPVYALVLARAGRSLGPDMQPSKHDCAAFFAAGGTALAADAPRLHGGRFACARGMIPGRAGGVSTPPLGGATIADLIKWMDTFGGLDRQVMDETNLTGTFDIRLEIATRASALRPPDLTGRPSAPEIHQAVQEQLGLKLERRTAPMRALVIDSIDRPTAD
jgi:uncharacterized protein (TIGR03435 family)